MNLLSAQQMVDCVPDVIPRDRPPKYDLANNFTQAASFDDAFKFVKDVGLYTEEVYPFMRRKGPCTKHEREKVTIYGHYILEKEGDQSEVEFREAVVKELKNQPLGSIIKMYKSFKAYNDTCTIYMGGTTVEKADKKQGMKHAVVVLASGTHLGVDFYLIKNSFGTGWGHSGFGLVAQDLLQKFAFPYSTSIKE